MNDATERLLRARVRPTRRPVMRQRRDDLFFLHWEYSAAMIQARLPVGLTVDTFEGKAYLGVVGFRMNVVRPADATAWSDLPLRRGGFDVGGHAPDLAHGCQGVAIEAFSLVPSHA